MISRMTIGMLREMLSGKAAAIEEKIADATPFKSQKQQTVEDFLHENGFQHEGNEVFYCGYTSRRIEGKVFVGLCTYQRLKHLAPDKIHSRSTGPRQVLVRQPVEGRARDGGL